jgi:type IV pilus assembly protein PilO
MAGKLPSISLRLDTAALAAQFANLRGRHPGLWPVLPRTLLLTGVFVAIVLAGYAVYWRGLFEELQAGRDKEDSLKVQYADKLKQAINLAALRRQKQQVDQMVSQLEKQLPSKAELDAVLSEINHAGVGRGAQLVLFKPGDTVVREYYAELPIEVRIVGSYHDLGAFASDLANLSRIVTLNSIQINPRDGAGKDKGKDGALTMDATARTFRYLDPEEVAEQRNAAAKKNPGAPK